MIGSRTPSAAFPCVAGCDRLRVFALVEGHTRRTERLAAQTALPGMRRAKPYSTVRTASAPGAATGCPKSIFETSHFHNAAVAHQASHLAVRNIPRPRASLTAVKISDGAGQIVDSPPYGNSCVR